MVLSAAVTLLAALLHHSLQVSALMAAWLLPWGCLGMLAQGRQP